MSNLAAHFEREAAIRASASLDPVERLVLLIIEAHADNATGRAYLSKTTIAAETGLSPRAVDGVVAKATSSGWLAVEPGAGPHGCNIYWVTPVASDRRPPPRPPGRPAGKTPAPHAGGISESPRTGGRVDHRIPSAADDENPRTRCPRTAGSGTTSTAVCDRARAREAPEHTHIGVTDPDQSPEQAAPTPPAPPPPDPLAAVAAAELVEQLPHLASIAGEVAEDGRHLTFAALAVAIRTARKHHGANCPRSKLMIYVERQLPLDPADERDVTRELAVRGLVPAPRNPRKGPCDAPPPPAAPPPGPPPPDIIAAFTGLRATFGAAPNWGAAPPVARPARPSLGSAAAPARAAQPAPPRSDAPPVDRPPVARHERADNAWDMEAPR